MERVVVKGSIKDLKRPGRDLAYWLAQPAAARLEAVEALRLQMHPELANADQRIQGVCRVVTRARR